MASPVQPAVSEKSHRAGVRAVFADVVCASLAVLTRGTRGTQLVVKRLVERSAEIEPSLLAQATLFTASKEEPALRLFCTGRRNSSLVPEVGFQNGRLPAFLRLCAAHLNGAEFEKLARALAAGVSQLSDSQAIALLELFVAAGGNGAAREASFLCEALHQVRLIRQKTFLCPFLASLRRELRLTAAEGHD